MALMITSIVITSITEAKFFYYAIAVLCPLGSIVTTWFIFQQKEAATPIDKTPRAKSAEDYDGTRNQRVTQIIEMEEQER